MILVTAALKGGVGKTTTSVYLAAMAASNRRDVTLVDADPQASAAEWIEASSDERLQRLEVVEAPTDRLLTKALERVKRDDVVVVDTPPGHERLTARALDLATVVVVPTRVGGVETSRAGAVLDLMPSKLPYGLVFCSARTFTRDYQDALVIWHEAKVPVWGTIPERVTIAAGPEAPLSFDGFESYRKVWRRALTAARG
ncbi:MAG TPA: ParA family protein [Acidimicrobiales bacterium]